MTSPRPVTSPRPARGVARLAARLGARLRARLSREDGITLPELLVTITILSLVMSGVTAAYVSTSRGIGAANVTMEDLGIARNAYERVTQLIRSASDPTGAQQGSRDGNGSHVAFDLATSRETVFYSTIGRSVDQDPVRVRIVVDAAGDLVEQVWQPAPGPTWPGAPVTRVLVSDLANTAVFTFLTEDRTNTTCFRVLGSAGTLTTAQLFEIDAVEVALDVQRPSGYDSTPAELSGLVRIAAAEGLGYAGQDQGECGP